MQSRRIFLARWRISGVKADTESAAGDWSRPGSQRTGYDSDSSNGLARPCGKQQLISMPPGTVSAAGLGRGNSRLRRQPATTTTGVPGPALDASALYSATPAKQSESNRFRPRRTPQSRSSAAGDWCQASAFAQLGPAQNPIQSGWEAGAQPAWWLAAATIVMAIHHRAHHPTPTARQPGPKL